MTPLTRNNEPEAKQNDENTTPNKWTNIPKDILTNLIKYLDLKIDIPRIRGVCPTWRNNLPLDEILLLPPRIVAPPFDDQSGLSLVLVETRFYLISPRHGPNKTPWLTRMCEKRPRAPRCDRLLNPFNLQDLFISDPSITGGISLLDCHILEVAKPLTLFRQNEDDAMSKKVVGGWNFRADYIYAVMAQLEAPFGGSGEGSVVFMSWCDQKWVRIEDTLSDKEDKGRFRILDIAYHKGKFYAFELLRWKVGVIDPVKESISLEFIAAPDILGEPVDNSFSLLIDGCSYLLNELYLVPSGEDLYLVVGSSKVGSKIVTMIVFILKEGKWERVTSLLEQMLFIGYDVSFGISSSLRNSPNWKPGSICLFTTPFPMIYDACMSDFRGLPVGTECLNVISFPEYWRYLRMYNMGEDEKGVVSLADLSMKDSGLSRKECTGLFFPPPAWVKWRCPILDNVDVMLHNVTFSVDSDDNKCRTFYITE